METQPSPHSVEIEPSKRPSNALLLSWIGGGVLSILWVTLNPSWPDADFSSAWIWRRLEAAYAALFGLLGLVALTISHEDSKRGVPQLRRTARALLAATAIGTALVMIDGVPNYFREHVQMFRAPPAPPWEQWLVPLLQAGVTWCGGATAIVLAFNAYLGSLPPRARYFGWCFFSVTALVLIDHLLNPSRH